MTTGVETLKDPSDKGLYRSSFEHDACGVGMICNLSNRKNHTLVQDALKILANLTHRGACGCDETTGDGAGILIQKPHLFLQQAAREATIHLPPEMDYAAGLVFLPSDKSLRKAAQAALSAAAEEKGLNFLGWRSVPVNPDAAGDLARRVMPVIQMAFVGRGDTGRVRALETVRVQWTGEAGRGDSKRFQDRKKPGRQTWCSWRWDLSDRNRTPLLPSSGWPWTRGATSVPASTS